MQCKVLMFHLREHSDKDKMENSINQWLAKGWQISGTTSLGPYSIYVFLTK